MKNLRGFGLIILVFYAIFLMTSCGQMPNNDSVGENNLHTIGSLATSMINKLRGTSAPILYQTKSPSIQQDNLVSYGFNSSKAGTISYSGGCFGSTKNAFEGDHHIVFITMVEGKYEDCSIKVTDSEGNTSEPLYVPPFNLDFSAPELSKVGDLSIHGSNIKIELQASESGKLSFNGNCRVDLQQIKKGISEVLVIFPGDGQFTDCELKLLDASGNLSEPLALGTVFIDSTPPVLTEINPVQENISTDMPSYSFKTSKSGKLSFSGKCTGNVENAVAGINHISLLAAEPGNYNDCEMTITDSSNNKSQPMKISPFVVLGDQS